MGNLLPPAALLTVVTVIVIVIMMFPSDRSRIKALSIILFIRFMITRADTPANLQGIPGFGTNSTKPSSDHTKASSNPSQLVMNSNNPPLNLPQSISESCQRYLNQLNSNSDIKDCTAPLLNATTSFATGPQSVKADQVKAAFEGLCSPNSGSKCEPNMIYHLLNQFAGNCTQELYQGIEIVKTTYDVLYILTPYRVALCSKDPATNSYCPSVIASAVVNGTTTSDQGNSSFSPSDFKSIVTSVFGSKLNTQFNQPAPNNTQSTPNHPSLRARAQSSSNFSQSIKNFNQTNATSNEFGYHPNADFYTNTNLAFLFLSPNLPQSALCRPCTQSILAAYIGFEQAIPHIGGLSSSGYLSGQMKLWQAVSRRCGQPFIDAINQEAGIMSAITSGAANLMKQLLTFQSFIILITTLSIGTIKLFMDI
ncbi:hypothetical protein O181_088476 [Austropuccinia psidii MF-1]|uniref:DUF7729 domain-containing protein n=1 Tax=Austropuccinia psidii MF-1 TaxID=1389203 RepID=A0A9Q3IRQ0_9BASI|nr:hypothetical protein [Austropuccinia psidii MF-1]